jgi:hypothetical protein
MANSLFVSLELQRPDKNYDRVVAALASLGNSCTQLQFTLWYLKVDLGPGQVRDRLKPALEKGDRLFIIDATNNRMASTNLPADASRQLSDQDLQNVS